MTPGEHVCYVDAQGNGHHALAEHIFTGEGFDSKGGKPTIDLIYVDQSGRQEVQHVRHVSFYDSSVSGHFYLEGLPKSEAEKVAKDQLEELTLQATEEAERLEEEKRAAEDAAKKANVQ